jgi:hypothetical protein
MTSEIQILSNEFNTLINKYQDTYHKYINVISNDNKSFKIVEDSSFFGQKQINIINNTDISNCESSCISNTSCSGATFNTISNKCTLSSGTGNIVSAHKSNAIVQEALYYSYELQKLNTNLMNINQKMMNISNDNYNQYQKTHDKSKEQEETMNKNYETLNIERNNIEQMIREYETLDKAYDNGNIIVTSNYYKYIIFLFIVLLLLLIFFKFSVITSQSGGGLSKININKLLNY